MKVAMGQLLVEGGDISANLQRAADMISNGGNKGRDIILISECLEQPFSYLGKFG